MGLDIALGIIVLLGGLRGYFRGFLLQAIHLSGLVGSVYLANPIRDLARPHARAYLSGIDPVVLDKLLWWTAAVLCYIVTTGAATSLVRMYRRKAIVELEPNRGDQGLGFLLGAIKTSVLLAFLLWGIQSQIDQYKVTDGWMPQQVASSRVVAFSIQHEPARRIWTAPPVQSLVAHIRKEGLGLVTPELNAQLGSAALEAASQAGSKGLEEAARQTGADALESVPSSTAERARSALLPPKRGLPRLEVPARDWAAEAAEPEFIDRLDEVLTQEGLRP